MCYTQKISLKIKFLIAEIKVSPYENLHQVLGRNEILTLPYSFKNLFAIALRCSVFKIKVLSIEIIYTHRFAIYILSQKIPRIASLSPVPIAASIFFQMSKMLFTSSWDSAEGPQGTIQGILSPSVIHTSKNIPSFY